jgi:LmbE family N-acetylglucosaminyl deacetylase
MADKNKTPHEIAGPPELSSVKRTSKNKKVKQARKVVKSVSLKMSKKASATISTAPKRPAQFKTAKKASSKKVVVPVAKAVVQPQSRFMRIICSKSFSQLFAVGSVVLLLLTIIFWALLSARLQLMNADQLSDSYLFQNGAAFKGAGFPSAHTFLIKWPLFLAIRVLGNTPFVFALATAFFVILTVAVFVFILYKIERRPLVFGCICLALTSVLLLIPAQPYPSALLPVNMAMITTRNIEYVVFIGALYLMLRATRIRSSMFVLGCVLMALLAASDTLFSVLGIGGAVLALCAQRLLQWRKADSRPFSRWIIGSIVAAILAKAILAALDNRGITHIISQGNLSPYGAVQSPHQFFEAVIFAIGAFLTNLGANPIHGLLVIKDGPSLLIHSLSKPSIIAYIANFAIAGFGLWSVYRVLRGGKHDTWTRLSIALIWSTVAAFGVFIVTNHYYPVDSRYVSITLFTLFIAAAVYLRSRQFRKRNLYIIGIIILCVIPFGVASSWHEYKDARTALSYQDSLTHKVADILEKDHISHLMGDYWSVLPVKAYSPANFTVLPVTPCNDPRIVLTSSASFKLKHNQPVAFLATRDGGDAQTYVGCTLSEIHSLYGDATSSNVIAGDAKTPSAILYTYAQGFGHITKHNDPIVTFVPIPPEAAIPIPALPADKCAGKTTVNVMAHEDDDLLFMSPDLLRDIHSGRCIITVYMTAGDAGHGQAYGLSRQAGAEAAYSFMYAAPNTWQEEYGLLNGHIVTIDKLVGNTTMELIFMHLPDGGLRGVGFTRGSPNSLDALHRGSISTITTEDGLATYSQADITNSLHWLYQTQMPTEVRTQNYSNDLLDGDHSDHHAAGFFAQEAFKDYDGTATLRAYAGYPMRNYPINVRDGDRTEKLLTFLVYAAHDPAVCQNTRDCDNSGTYGSYLTRQYSRIVATHQASPTH